MSMRRRPHPFISTVLGALTAVPAHHLAVAVGATWRAGFAVAVIAAMALGFALGLFVHKADEE